MNPVALYFASGEALYPGAVLLLLAMAISPYVQALWQVRLRNIAGWLALAMIVMACPPFPWIVDAIFLGTFALWFIAWNQTAPGQSRDRLRPTTTIILLVLLLVLPTMERSHRTIPLISGEPSDHLVVIGDSISAGLGSNVPAWPVVFQQLTGMSVKNLAGAGAQTIDAQVMAEKVTQDDRVVLVEIGGNDLLMGVPSKEFEHALDALLSKLVKPGRSVAMFELPLLPHKIAYGQIQRRLAAKYGIYLIPKRYFADVIGGADATSDGLHLSTAGAHRMAELVARIFAPILKAGTTEILTPTQLRSSSPPHPIS
jgi:acyl-CoA thioesterase-1